MKLEAEVAIKAQSTLGEAAYWCAKRKVLYWIDIKGKLLNEFDPVKNVNRSRDIGRMPGTVVCRAKGGVIIAAEDGVGSFDMESGKFEVLVQPEKDKPENRANDGKCDPAGRFWYGTMGRKAEKGVGTLYRIEKDLRVTPMLSGMTISNGIVWTSDAKTMYFIDSPTREIVAYGYDVDSGNIRNPRAVVQVGQELGVPDGMTIDSEDMLWVAHYGSGKVVRWNPENGEKIGEVNTPGATATSSCSFGGEKMDQLFITTAREKKENEENAGDVFVVQTKVRGAELAEFGG